MKHTAIITGCLLLLSALLVSCNDKALSEREAPHHHSEWKAITQVMDHQPEKAMRMLDSVESREDAAQWSAFDRNEYLLLTVVAQYKNGILSPQSQDLKPVVAFYDSLAMLYPRDKELQLLLAESYYYSATEGAMSKKDGTVFNSYLQSLKIVETYFPDDDSYHVMRFKALIHTRLGEILYGFNLMNQAMMSFQNAADYFNKVHDTIGEAAMIRNQGSIYQVNKEYEKALAQFNEAARLAPMDEDLFLHSKGGLFLAQKEYDSAIWYLERSFRLTDVHATNNAAADLAELYRQRGDREKENYYTNYYVSSTFSEANKVPTKMEIDYLYGHFLTEHAASGVKHPERKLELFFIIAFAVLALGIFAYVIVRNRRRIQHIEKQITVIEAKHQQETEGKDAQLKNISQQLSDTQQELQRRSNPSHFSSCWNQYINSDIYQKINALVAGKDIMTKSVTMYPKLKLRDTDLIELVQTMNDCFPEFSTRLLKTYPRLSSSDLRHCCLAVSGWNDAEIAVLEGISYSGANRKTNRILNAMQADSSLGQTLKMFMENNW